MADTSTPRLFDDRTRRELLDQRVLVLDGVLDDDNGTLLAAQLMACLLYTSPSPRDKRQSRMPSSA